MRTVPGRDIGLVTPLDIAYDTTVGVFVVAGETSTGSAIVTVPPPWNPAEVSPTQDSSLLDGPGDLTAVNPADGLTYVLSPDGTQLEAYD
ncbi:MAG: hypothetical protein R3324_01515, partial [Halobacteriales archaeon]|nr:hypothetical protein [Halobacteriales archaeon]